MQKQKQKRLRWDRIALVGGVALVAAYGLAAVVPDGQDYDGSDSEGRVATVLSPELEASGSAAVPAEPVTEKVLPAPAKEIPARAKVEAASVGPIPSGPLPRKGIAPSLNG